MITLKDGCFKLYIILTFGFDCFSYVYLQVFFKNTILIIDNFQIIKLLRLFEVELQWWTPMPRTQWRCPSWTWCSISRPRTPGLNFINVFTRNFYLLRSRKRKKTDNLTVFLRFRNLRSQKLRINMLVKLTPGLNFINDLCTAFTLSDPKSVKRYWGLNCIFYAFGIYERKSFA